jgi:hypothetical protein
MGRGASTTRTAATPWRQRVGAALCAALALLLPGEVPAAQPSVAAEYEIKAAFLYNFLKFVEWPPGALAGADSPLVIGILGDDPFGPVLDQTVADKRLNGHPLVVKRLRRGEEPAGCQALFVTADAAAGFDRLVPSLIRQSVLTVGDAEGFVDRGGIIQFVIEDSKVRFDINAEAAEQAHLRLSSQLLGLARSPRKGARP